MLTTVLHYYLLQTQTITFSANVTDNRSVTSISLSGGVTATDSTGPDYTGPKLIMTTTIMEPSIKTLLLQHLMLLVINH